MNAAKDHLPPGRSLPRSILSGLLFTVALVSLAYAITTAPHQGKDLGFFQQGARDWLAGTYTMGEGPIRLYPPFAVPMFSPLALISFDKLVFIWLALNIAATIVTIYLAVRLFGAGWGTAERFYLFAFLLSWAPFRVTLRVGQISLMITALLLGALLARQGKRHVFAGVLLGLSLCKYTIALPFLLYFVWKRDWRIVGAAGLTAAALTAVFSLRLGMPPITMLKEYVRVIGEVQTTGVSGWKGTTEIQMLLLGMTGGNESLTFVLTIALCAVALIAMALVFKRTPQCENIHFAVLSLFALWSSFHRTYDSVLCVLPAALLIDFIRRGRFRVFSWAGLGGLGLLVLSIPGWLTERLGLSASELSASPLGFVGLHIERFLVFGLFCSLLVLLWKSNRCEPTDVSPYQT